MVRSGDDGVLPSPRRSPGVGAPVLSIMGRWKPVVLRRNPTELRLRHLASPLLVLGLVGSALLGAASLLLPGMEWALAASMAMPLFYAAAIVLGAVVVGLLRRDASAVLLPVVLATMHLSWGVGFFLPARAKRSADFA